MATTTTSPQEAKLIAPVGHTIGLVLIILALCLLGAYQQSRPGTGGELFSAHRGMAPLYLSLIVSEWALVMYVRAGVRRKGLGLRALIGGRWRKASEVVLDFVIAAAFWPLWEGVAWSTHWALGPTHAKSIDVILPQGLVEAGLWVLLSVSAGFCEELVFRGYLQKQLSAMTGSGVAAVAGQAIIFGLGHGYQGFKQVVLIAVLGGLYGVLAFWRRSIRPGAIAHAWSDIFSGLVSPR
jgi:membrane protease YdiL (CAAX protease family)